MSGMHRPVGQFITEDEIVALEMWAQDAKTLMEVRLAQLDILRGALIDIRRKFGDSHSGVMATLALQKAGELALPENIVFLAEESQHVS